MKRCFVPVCTLVLALVLISSARAAEKVGVIVSIKAPVTIQREGAEFAANLGEEIHLGDLVRTGISGKAKILFEGRVILVIIDNTEVEISKHLYDPKENTTKSFFELKSGFVRTILEKYHDTSLDISSRNAVAGVRGTDFLMKYTPDRDQTQVYVLRGAVEVKSRLEAVPGAASVRERQWIEVLGSRPPGPAQALSKEAARDLEAKTSMPDQVSGKSHKAFRAARDAGGKAGERVPSKKIVGGAGLSQPQNPQVSVVGRDFIPPASIISGAGGSVAGAGGAAGSSGIGSAADRGIPGSSTIRVDQGGRPGDVGSAVGRPGDSGGVPDILGR